VKKETRKGRSHIFQNLLAATEFKGKETERKYLFNLGGQLQEFRRNVKFNTWKYVTSRIIKLEKCLNENDRHFYERYLNVSSFDDLLGLKSTPYEDPPEIGTEQVYSDSSGNIFKIISVSLVLLCLVILTCIGIYTSFRQRQTDWGNNVTETATSGAWVTTETTGNEGKSSSNSKMVTSRPITD
jgi:hypothetical protein